MANFLLSQTGEEVQEILNQAPQTKADLEAEVTDRENADAAEVLARNNAIAQALATALADYYTRQEVNGLMSDEVTARNAAIAEAIALALADYYTKNQIDTTMSNYSTTAQMTTAIQTAITTALEVYSTTADMNAAIAAALEPYYTKTEIDEKITDIQAQIDALLDGSQPSKLADNLTSWAERGETPQSEEWTDVVRTTGGDMSIDSSRGAKLLSVIPQSQMFSANALRATGFNLLHDAVAVGSGYYFEVPKLTFGVINTAEENNGVLFTAQNGDNLRPVVYFKPLTDGVPAHANDGEVCAYTDAGGYRFYTCNEPGYIIVSNITLAETCAHIAWSRRYNDFIAPDAQSDAGSQLPLASLIHLVHDYDVMMRLTRGEEYVYDELRAVSGNVNWYRRTERIQPTWETQDNGDNTYTHTATIEGMKSDGIAQCGSLTFSISGTTISYTDDQSEATADYVLYQLATPVSGSVEQTADYTVEDWGLEILTNVSGTAYITSQYYQSLPDAIAALLSKVPALREALTQEQETRVQNEKQLRLDLEAEESRAKQAEQTLQGNIDDEETRAKGAEQTLQGNIDSEQTARENADAAINAKIPQTASASNMLVDRQYLAEQIAAEVQARMGADADLQALIDAIVAKIPAAATAQNQLADKAFVNSSIASNTGSLVTDNGQPFTSVADLEAYSGTLHNNDYAFVVTTDQQGNTIYNRYKYNATSGQWAFEYALNNSSFTAAQFAAINSGITAELVSKLGDLPNATDLATQISTSITNALVNYYTKSEIDTTLAGYYTKTQIDTLIADYSTTAQMTTAITNALVSYYTKTDIDTLIADYSTTQQMTTAISNAITTALQSYSTTQDMNTAISTALASYYTKTEIDDLLNGYATTGALSSHTGNTTVHITAAERNAWNAKQAAITDGAQIGLGFGVSSEAATVQARTATIASFILLKNMPVSIRFTNAINVDSATLNISSTGAKPLFIQGAALQGGLVKGGCTVTVIYDGTNWNIVGIEGLERPASQSNLFVDMGLPSGRLWAIANIDVTKQSGFAEVDGKPSPFIYECTFFSWGNTEGHNPTSTSAFSYDWGSANDGPYAQTPGAQLTANAGLSFDAARAILGAPWRDPSTEDFAELFANIDFVQADGETVIDASQANKLVTVNGIVGIYLKSKINGGLLFFACSGYGYGQSWSHRGSGGHYWSRSLSSQTYGRNLGFNSGGVSPQYYDSRFYGFARRAVQ